jgi:hypothetical protein
MAFKRPLHPLVQQGLLMALAVGARAAARAVDSLLKDAAMGLGAAEDRVQKTRRNIKRKVRQSGVRLEDPPDTDFNPDDSEEE